MSGDRNGGGSMSVAGGGGSKGERDAAHGSEDASKRQDLNIGGHYSEAARSDGGSNGAPDRVWQVNMQNAAAALAALGHPLRLALWRMLVACGSAGLSAGMIAGRLSIPPSSLSFHLQQMAQAGVLLPRRSSRQIIYTVNNDLMEELCSFLAAGGAETMTLPAAVLSVAGQTTDVIGQ